MATVAGGEALRDHLKKLGARIRKAKEVRVGFLESATPYDDGTKVAVVAAIQNFGAPDAGIPPRPFFSNMVADKKGDWPEQFKTILKAVDYDAAKALEQIGAVIDGELRQSITDTNTPPLAPATVARKGFDKALVETGHMLASVDREVS